MPGRTLLPLHGTVTRCQGEIKLAYMSAQQEEAALRIVAVARSMKIGSTPIEVPVTIMGTDCRRFATSILSAFAGIRSATGKNVCSESARPGVSREKLSLWS